MEIYRTKKEFCIEERCPKTFDAYVYFFDKYGVQIDCASRECASRGEAEEFCRKVSLKDCRRRDEKLFSPEVQKKRKPRVEKALCDARRAVREMPDTGRLLATFGETRTAAICAAITGGVK